MSIHILNAQEGKNKELPFTEKLRPTLTKILGEKWTVKIIGAAPEEPKTEMQMPPLPKIISDATSTAVYSKKEDKVKLPENIEQAYAYGFIKEAFEATRQTKPTPDEANQYMNVLLQGGTREGIYRSLVLDSTYAGMEEWDKPVKIAAADFTVFFYDKYLGKKVDKKQFEGWSIFTLKRIMTEKALEMIDAYGDNRENLEKWYAILSADLATKFPSVWTNALRKQTSAEEHKKWASKVPVQHIKSEVIIKLHSAYNSMM